MSVREREREENVLRVTKSAEGDCTLLYLHESEVPPLCTVRTSERGPGRRGTRASASAEPRPRFSPAPLHSHPIWNSLHVPLPETSRHQKPRSILAGQLFRPAPFSRPTNCLCSPVRGLVDRATAFSHCPASASAG